jgi:2-polyprenyl-6-methoxyphenol hydroxylase-like FAD-dependent oxidoreductase
MDAVVVGARCAGSAVATALARAGRDVVVVDRARFPSDTLSTHLLFAGGVAELKALGARERVEALGSPRLSEAHVAASGYGVTTACTPIDGIDYSLCVRRPGLDTALVETARAAGAEVREGVRATGLLREGPRVTGVRVKDGDDERELRAPLVVGADGRRSTVARLIGCEDPYAWNPNGRACFFAYFDEGRPEWNGVAAQWRSGAELGTAFPCDGGLVLVLLMPPRARGGAFREDPQGEYERTLARLPELAERLRGCKQQGKVRGAVDLPSYFRRSAGPGWALAGDAGHFKDPVTAQGIRDALRFGRRLGELAAPVIDDPDALDAALARWERERDRGCLETYQWTNLLARGEDVSAFETELYRRMSRRPDLGRELLDVFARSRRPSQVITARRSVGFAVRALLRRRTDQPELLRWLARELGVDVRHRLQRLRLALSP